MATLEKIRNKAGLLVTVVGVALFAFIIGDLLNSGSSFINRNQNNVIVVDGEAVDYQEFMGRENELTEFIKIQNGIQTLPEQYMTQIRQSVFDEFVTEKILFTRFDELGIVVTPEEMTDMVEGENISPMLLQDQLFTNPQTGMFDRNALLMFLNQIKDLELYPMETQAQLMQYKIWWMTMEKNIKQSRMQEKYATLLSKAIVANTLDAKDAFENSLVSSDIVYAMESFSSIPDSSIKVTKSELEKLYDERKEGYRQDEACVIDFISIDIAPSAEDHDKVAQEMNAIRAEMETTDNIAALTNEKSENKFINAFFSLDGFSEEKDITDFIETAEVGSIEGPIFKDNRYRILKLVDKTEGPDSVNVSQMLIEPRETEAITRVYADSILNELKGGADFTEMVLKHSIDRSSENGGVMGWVTEAGILQGINEEFRKTSFSLAVGQCAVVKTNYGLHIIKVTDRTKDVPKYKIADILYTVTPSSATRSLLYNSLNQFIANNNTIEKMTAAAEENGYILNTNVRLASTDMIIGNSITGARQVIRWAFNNKKGQISEIHECDDKFVVAAHKGRLPKGYQSLESVTPYLQDEIIFKKKGELIAANLKAKNLSSIPAYAEAMSANPDTVKFITMATSRITNIGVEPKLNALVTYSPLNAVSEPVVGNNGVYVFEVIDRTNGNSIYDEHMQKSMIDMNNSYRIAGYAFRLMQQKADIVDNRIRFY